MAYFPEGVPRAKRPPLRDALWDYILQLPSKSLNLERVKLPFGSWINP
jgi:hypothetical protein